MRIRRSVAPELTQYCQTLLDPLKYGQKYALFTGWMHVASTYTEPVSSFFMIRKQSESLERFARHGLMSVALFFRQEVWNVGTEAAKLDNAVRTETPLHR